MDNSEKQKINIKLLQEKIDANLLNGSIEITLLNRIYKDKLIDEKIYKQAKSNVFDSVCYVYYSRYSPPFKASYNFISSSYM